MRLLFAIPHYFNPRGGGRYATAVDGGPINALRPDPAARVQALTACLAALRDLFAGPQCFIVPGRSKRTYVANDSQRYEADVVVCTTGGSHVLEQLPSAVRFYQHRETDAEPLMLGFECQAVLRDSLGSYDFFCFLEHDVILHDPWFFTKLAWFSESVGTDALLQPNRYELAPTGPVRKGYMDGALNPQTAARFQDIRDRPEYVLNAMAKPVVFHRPTNPHAACYFLVSDQMAFWASQPHFLDRDTSFVGPLESAATLGIMRTFRVYKPAPENASFLEVQHWGTTYVDRIGSELRLSENPVPPGG